MRRTFRESLRFAAYDALLEQDHRVRWLANPCLARIVVDSVRHGEGSRYELFGFAVMPNHVHLVIRPLVQPSGKHAARSGILSSFKRHTARRCNLLLGRRGRFWQDESYDRVVRDQEELARVVRYVEFNPVRAGLCQRIEDWPYSSAAALG